MSTDVRNEVTDPPGPVSGRSDRPAWPWQRIIRLGLGGLLAVAPLVVLPLNLLDPQLTWQASNSALSLGAAAAIFAILAYASPLPA